MFDPSSFAGPAHVAHADTSSDVLPRGGTSQRHRLSTLRIKCLRTEMKNGDHTHSIPRFRSYKVLEGELKATTCLPKALNISHRIQVLRSTPVYSIRTEL
ncbi:hypothetical protein TNCV_3592441 [Trichonephila clavipes]|nr:hypothetical protein TNCV_3592441 [Trichonephila clavipes]